MFTLAAKRLARSTKLQNVRGFASSPLNSFASGYPTTQVSVLSNGMRVATEPADGDTATVGVWIDTGSRYETKANNGVAHFLEHMFFKGTARRSRVQLEKEVENMGGHLNAYTSREQTVFFTKAFKADARQAVDILADILQNSQFRAEDIDMERGTILTEMQEVNGVMEEVVFDRLHETAYRGGSLGRTILGPTENIKSITKQDIETYLNTHYTAPRMVLCGAGIDHAELVKYGEELFGNLPTTGNNVADKGFNTFSAGDLLIRMDDMEEAHVGVAFPVAGWGDADSINMTVIESLLGNFYKSKTGLGVHSHSPLVQQADANGGTNSLMTFHTQYSDTGLFGLYGNFEPTSVYEMSQAMVSSLSSLGYEVSEEDLAVAKAQVKLNVFAHSDGTTAYECENIGREMLYNGRKMHATEMLARIDAIDTNSIKNTAKRYFVDRDFALIGIGSIHELPDYQALRKLTYNHF